MAADETLPPAFAQKGNDPLVSGAASARDFIAGCYGKNVRVLAECFNVFVDVGADRCYPAFGFDGGRLDHIPGMRRRNRAAERIGQRVVDLACDVVEGPPLIEAPHVDRPFDRRPVPADRELP